MDFKSNKAFIEQYSILTVVRFTDESLRWVIANGQIGRAKEIIKNACKWNGKDYIEVMEKIGWGGLLDANSKLVIMTDYNSGKDQTALGPLTADIDEHKSADNHQTALNQVNSNAKDARGPLVRQNNFERSDSELEVVDEVGDDDDLKVQKYTLLDIFRHKRILIVSMIMWYSWLVSLKLNVHVQIIWRWGGCMILPPPPLPLLKCNITLRFEHLLTYCRKSCTILPMPHSGKLELCYPLSLLEYALPFVNIL
jgi:hypothetical protein